MTKTILLATVAFILYMSATYAQGTADSSEKKSIFFKNMRLRQSFETSDQMYEPAQIQVTVPSGHAADWLLDAGLSADIVRLGETTTTSTIVEYHRNTVIASPQNNFQAGLCLNYFGNKSTGINSIITANLKYVRDWQNPSGSVAITGNYTIYNQDEGLRFNKAGYFDSWLFTYNLNPYVGFQEQAIGGTPANNGNIFRPLANVSAALALDEKKLTAKQAANAVPKKRLELVAGYVVRYALINSTGNGEGYTELFTAGLNYYIVNNNKINLSLGGSYNHGSDPLVGLDQQSYWQICLQAELTRKK